MRRPRCCRFGRSDYAELGIVKEPHTECEGSCERVYVVFTSMLKRELE